MTILAKTYFMRARRKSRAQKPACAPRTRLALIRVFFLRRIKGMGARSTVCVCIQLAHNTLPLQFMGKRAPPPLTRSPFCPRNSEGKKKRAGTEKQLIYGAALFATTS